MAAGVGGSWAVCQLPQEMCTLTRSNPSEEAWALVQPWGGSCTPPLFPVAGRVVAEALGSPLGAWASASFLHHHHIDGWSSSCARPRIAHSTRISSLAPQSNPVRWVLKASPSYEEVEAQRGWVTSLRSHS